MKCVPRLDYSVIPRSSVEFLAIGIVCFFESRCRDAAVHLGCALRCCSG